ncbi:MAG: GyrI-like domain-containing protein [Candidatus Kariarchaeaceae archaeon]|jgi:effector-binding domain-containing protein
MGKIENNIEYKKIDETKVAYIRTGIKTRDDISEVIQRLTIKIPKEIISGSAYGRTFWVTSVPKEEGFDMEIGFPVSKEFEKGEIQTKINERREVFSITHKGSIDKKNETYGKLLKYIRNKKVISDEYSMEIYIDNNNPKGEALEFQYVVHNWQELFKQHSERVLGSDATKEIIPEHLPFDSSAVNRLDWAKEAITNVKNHTSDPHQLYNILSSCAHVFPIDPILKMKEVYERRRDETKNPLAAIDSVLDMMKDDNAWGNRPYREGNVIIATKNPADRESFEKATTPEERRRAACFCPVIRDHLEDEDIPKEYCLCSAGWERRQWELTLSKPVKVDVRQSVLQGDDLCQFAIHIPNELTN